MTPLDPAVKKWADKIYELDKQKFKRLVVWIRAAERTYSTEVIVATLSFFYAQSSRVTGRWWPYLDKLLDNYEGKINARNAEAKSARHKEEDRELAAMFRGDWLGAKSR